MLNGFLDFRERQVPFRMIDERSNGSRRTDGFSEHMTGEGTGGNCIYVLGEDRDLHVSCHLFYVTELGCHTHPHARFFANFLHLERKFDRFLSGRLEVRLEVNQQEWFGMRHHLSYNSLMQRVRMKLWEAFIDFYNFILFQFVDQVDTTSESMLWAFIFQGRSLHFFDSYREVFRQGYGFLVEVLRLA
jgi:hypothetical protein